MQFLNIILKNFLSYLIPVGRT